MPLVDDTKYFLAGEEKFWLAFSRVPGIGLARQRRLCAYFGGLEAAWRARPADLLAAGLEPRLTERLMTFRPAFEPDREMERLGQAGIGLLVLGAPGYPERLAQIDNPPPVLYYKGDLTPADNFALAVVGTRRATSYGRQAVARICSELAGQGVTIVSGLARGIDTSAHQAALEGNGRTLAVLGCGVDIIYPVENKHLAERISGGQGALISEYPPGTKPEASNFPPRNRIVSGLSIGVFIVESGEKGGAMITVTSAGEQGRDVYALPGSIFNLMSAGPNQLLRQGARAVTSAADILEEIRPGGLFDAEERQDRATLAQHGDTDQERLVIRVLKQAGEPAHIDDICNECGLPMAELSSLLMLMELKGLVQGMGGMRYGLTRLVL